MLVYFLVDLIRLRYLNSFQSVLFGSISRFIEFVRKFRKMDLLKNSSSDITSSSTSKAIVFKADDKTHCFETNKSNVTVIGSVGQHDHGSSKVKLKSIVDYKWEVKNYPGRLIAVHLAGKHIAYAIKVNNKEGKSEGMVRVVNSSSGFRALIKGMSSEVLDLEFANLKATIVLGCIERGAIHVHRIENLSDKIICTLLIKIEDAGPEISSSNDQIKWCPYVPADETTIDDEYVGKQLVWVRANTYECYSIHSVVDAYGVGTHSSKSIEEGCLSHKEMTNITCAVYSPDGTTLCVSCEDGHVRFYQVYFHTNESNPRRIHEWVPHGGKKITSLFFLDNHTKCISDNSLWKHAITASDNNTEIKVWCCSTWNCLQTIHFKPPPNASGEFNFKVEIDRTSSYLILSDIKNRGLYVMQIIKDLDADETDDLESNKNVNNIDENNSGPTNGKEFSVASIAYIKSIAEFPLSWPILSFGIVDASVRKYKCAFNDSYLADELDDYDEESHDLICVVIHMFIVQPKSVQECHVLYQPTVAETTEIGSSISSDGFKELKNISNVSSSSSVEKSIEKFNKSDIQQQHLMAPRSDSTMIVKSPKQNKKENASTHANLVSTQTKSITLVTPDSFHSPGKITPDGGGGAGGESLVIDQFYSPEKSEGVSNEVLNTLRMLAKAPDIRQKSVENKNLLNLVNNKVIEEQEQQKLRQSSEAIIQKLVPPMPSAPLLAQTSGGSSPSREVQEILSLKDSDCLNEFYDVPIDMSDENDGESDDNKRSASESYNFNDNSCNSKVQTKTGVTNKNEWPKLPQAPPIMISSKYNNINNSSNNVVNEINFKMDQLLDLKHILEAIQTQTCQISELKNEVMELQKKNSVDSHKYDQFTKNIEFRLSKLIEEYLIRYERENNKRLEAFVTARDNQRDSLLHSMAQIVITQIHERISQVIVSELQRNVLPLVAGKLDGIKTQIHTDVIQKLTSSDLLFKEGVAKICTNKETITAVSNAIVTSIQTGFQKIYTDSLKTILIPAYEKSSEEMFKQIQHVFLQGTKSYIHHFETFSSQYQPGQEDLISLLNSLPEQLKTVTTTTLTNVSTQMHNDMTKDLRSLQCNLIKSLRDNIKNEMQKGFETQAGTIEESVLSVVRSQAQTPAPSIFDVQEQIKTLLSQGEINAAFHQALVANDLNLVEYTLEKADFNAVFNPCPLQQTVLLSLIQQISADMTNHNEIKQKYLADAILNLNLRDATTKEHAPKIMRELYQHCQNFTEINTTNPLCSGVRMLMMAIQGLGLKLF